MTGGDAFDIGEGRSGTCPTVAKEKRIYPNCFCTAVVFQGPWVVIQRAWYIEDVNLDRAASSAGRALRSQCRGRGFDPPAVHQNSARRLYLILGGNFSSDFLTMSSSLPSILTASDFSSLAMARQTRERVLGSRRSITNVPSVNGTRTIRVPKPRHPAG